MRLCERAAPAKGPYPIMETVMKLICVDSRRYWCYAELIEHSSLRPDYQIVRVPDLWKSYDIHLFVTGVWKPKRSFWSHVQKFLIGRWQ